MASGCLSRQLLPTHTVTSSPATSALCANATAGHYWAFIPSELLVPAEELVHVIWVYYIVERSTAFLTKDGFTGILDVLFAL